MLFGFSFSELKQHYCICTHSGLPHNIVHSSSTTRHADYAEQQTVTITLLIVCLYHVTSYGLQTVSVVGQKKM